MVVRIPQNWRRLLMNFCILTFKKLLASSKKSVVPEPMSRFYAGGGNFKSPDLWPRDLQARLWLI